MIRPYVLVNNFSGGVAKTGRGKPRQFFTLRGAMRARSRMTILGMNMSGMFDILRFR